MHSNLVAYNPEALPGVLDRVTKYSDVVHKQIGLNALSILDVGISIQEVNKSDYVPIRLDDYNGSSKAINIIVQANHECINELEELYSNRDSTSEKELKQSAAKICLKYNSNSIYKISKYSSEASILDFVYYTLFITVGVYIYY